MEKGVISLLAVQPRDVYALVEISHRNVHLLAEAMKRCEISIDKQDPKELEIEECFVSFFQQISNMDKELGEQYGSPSDPK